jgi:hypothetical protein
MLFSVGAGLSGALIVKLMAPDVPPPGAGVCTVTEAVPAEVRSDAGTCAVNEVLETYVVASAVPFQATSELEMNPVPVAVSVKAPLPAAAEFGLMLLSAGAGF